uniref:AIG1-type G domain-containing protein n=1 Tax=Hucho hucho TaxID=62062 RepID=A0A4W5KW89_9TELE
RRFITVKPTTGKRFPHPGRGGGQLENCDSLHLSELRIVLLGSSDAGKSSCVKRQGEVTGRQVTVVDTPGPHTILLVIQVDKTFKEGEVSAVEEHLELLSETTWSHTIVLFTHGDCLGDTTIEQHIERQVKALQWLVEKCGNRYHVLNTENRGDGTQITELLEKLDELVVGICCCFVLPKHGAPKMNMPGQNDPIV